MIPEDIPPTRYANPVLAVCILLLSLICWAPIFGTLYYDGFRSIFEWTPLFRWFLLIGTLMLLLALQLLVTKKRAGAEVTFHPDGFTLDVRQFLLRRFRQQVAWVDIEEMRVVEGGRSQDSISFRLTPEAAVRKGLIPVSASEDRSPRASKREIVMPVKLSAVGTAVAVERFMASAELAGAGLSQTLSRDYLLFKQRTWTVTHL